MEKKEEQYDILSVTDRSVGNKNRWVIDSECSQHIVSNMKMFSSYTSVQEGQVFMENSTTSKVIGEGTIQFRSHNGCITTLSGVYHVPESRFNLISLGALHREEFCFRSKGDLMEVSKQRQALCRLRLSQTAESILDLGQLGHGNFLM